MLSFSLILSVLKFNELNSTRTKASKTIMPFCMKSILYNSVPVAPSFSTHFQYTVRIFEENRSKTLSILPGVLLGYFLPAPIIEKIANKSVNIIAEIINNENRFTSMTKELML